MLFVKFCFILFSVFLLYFCCFFFIFVVLFVCYVAFKQGAFEPRLPIQPVYIRYPHMFCDPAFVGPSMGKIALQVMCQFVNFVEIEFLPVYDPNNEEQKDAKVFTIFE
jgi:hypothetical protein